MKKFSTRLISCVLSLVTLVSCFGGLGLSVSAASSLKVPAGVKYYKGHMYYAFKNKTTWNQAKKSCEKRGGHLVVITSKGEQEFVASMIEGDSPGSCIYYIGLYDASKTCKKWEDLVTGQKASYTNWNSSQPKSPSGKAYYGAIYENGGKWVTTQNDASDSDYVALGYICEWEVGKTTKIKQIEATASSVTLSWRDNDLASKYIIYYYDTATKKYHKYKTVTKASITISGLERATTYKIAISNVFNNNGKNTIAPKVVFNAVTLPGKTKNLKIEDKITLTWSKVKGADGYTVYSYNASGKKWEYFDTVKKNSCPIGKKFGSATQKFKVRAFKKSTDGTKFYGGYSNIVSR